MKKNITMLQLLVPFLFEAKTYGHLPKIHSRRFWGLDQFGFTAYKSDADNQDTKDKKDQNQPVEIKTGADLLKQLNIIKTGLEEKAKKDASDVVDEKIKEVNEKMEAIKGLPADITAEDLQKLFHDFEVNQKAIDKLQIIIGKNRSISQQQIAEEKTFDQRIKEAIEEATDDIGKFQRKETKRFDIEIKGINQKTVGAFSTGNVDGSRWGQGMRPGIIMNPNTMTHVRSLLNVQNAGPGTDWYFMHEEGLGEGEIAAVAEATAAATPTTKATGLKPQFDLDLKEEHVPFEIIAGWMLISRKALNNIPGITSFLQQRLPEKLMDAEDYYLLYGSGTNNEVKGILTAGNFTASTSGETTLALNILDDIILLEDTYKRVANGIVLRPAAYMGLFKNQASGSGEFDLPQGVVFTNNQLTMWGIPVSKTTALVGDDFVVGDFRNGADLLIQESMRLEFFEQDNINVRTNQVTVRIEETVALPVYGSTYFIKGTNADYGS